MLKNRLPGLPLRLVLVVPFVLEIFAAVGLTGYISFRSGQSAVRDLASQLRNEISQQIEGHLDSYLSIPKLVNKINVKAIDLGYFEIDNLESAEEYLWHQIQFFDTLSYIQYGQAGGMFYGVRRENPQAPIFLEFSDRAGDKNFYSHRSTERGKIGELVDSFDYNMEIDVWYADAVKAGKPIWSSIYHAQKRPEIVNITASYPVYNHKGELQYVTGSDLLLSGISQFISQLKVAKYGATFIIEPSGFLVASSNLNDRLFVLKEETSERVKAEESQNQIIRSAARYIAKEFGTIENLKNSQQLEFWIERERYFLQLSRYQDGLGLDWAIAVVIPERYFMEQIHANTRRTIALSLAALIIATAIGIITAHWVTAPIFKLNQAAKDIAKGDWKKTVNIRRNDEVGELAQSFNNMARQLQESFATLEQRVEERTAELEIANRAKSTFIANMSHELRSPLNAILGFTQIMTRSQTLSPENQESVSIINRSGEHLLTLINNVLDLSKIEAGRITLNEKNFDLHRLLDDIHDMFQLKATDKGLQLLLEPADDIPRYIRTDEVKLRQILINLINNALKFTELGGICIRSKRIDASKIAFEVEDTGPGIAPEDLDKLFEAFSQTESGKQAQEGTGLGLSISRKFVQLMGGEMRVSSQLGQGTTFGFEIMISEVSATEVESQQVNKRRIIGLEADHPPYRILIVDDKLVNRQLLVKLLSPFGFELASASNGKEAVDISVQWRPHLIWMDMRMPVMDGLEATQRIKGTTPGQRTAIIALTASVLEEERAVVLSAGCDDFLRKPFREDDIFQMMSKHLGVRYVYDDLTPTQKETPQERDVLSSENIQALSPLLLVQLRLAVVSASKRDMAAVVEAIGAENAKLAEAIAQCLYNFEYDKILNLMPQEDSSL